jgi:murein DD-endopeptidase MepM/ murein hydrolase activator NlpD
MAKTPIQSAISQIPKSTGSTPVALGLGGIASLMLISGIQGKSISELLQGSFGAARPPVAPGADPPGGTLGKGGVALAPETPLEPQGALPKSLYGKAISPFPKSSKVVWGRNDQGVDGTTNPGSPMLAMGNGVVKIMHDPNGFGANYPVLFIDNDGAYYYGHSAPAVPGGTRVKEGQVIAHANTNGQGNAHTPGSFEIGTWPPGSFSTAGAAIRKWFTSLPRI